MVKEPTFTTKNMYGKDCIHIELDIEANYDMCRLCHFEGCLDEEAHVFTDLEVFHAFLIWSSNYPSIHGQAAAKLAAKHNSEDSMLVNKWGD